MAKPRVPETDHGIVGEFEVAAYDEMQRRFRDKGWIQTSQILSETGSRLSLYFDVYLPARSCFRF